MELRGDRVVLRPLAEADVSRIVELGADPEEDGAVDFAIVFEGEVAGMFLVAADLR